MMAAGLRRSDNDGAGGAVRAGDDGRARANESWFFLQRSQIRARADESKGFLQSPLVRARDDESSLNGDDQLEMAGFYAIAAVVGTCHDFSGGRIQLCDDRPELQKPCRRWSIKRSQVLSCRCRNCEGGEMPRFL